MIEAPVSLGECIKCHGPLCLRGQVVACDRCGVPQLDHALTKELADYKAPPPVAVETPPSHYVATYGDRIKALEGITAAQDRTIKRLCQQVDTLSKKK